MRPEIRQILLTMVLPLFLIFILYMIKVLEIGMDWDFTSLGEYTLCQKRYVWYFHSSSYT